MGTLSHPVTVFTARLMGMLTNLFLEEQVMPPEGELVLLGGVGTPDQGGQQLESVSRFSSGFRFLPCR